MASTKMEVQLQLLWAQYEKGLAEAEKATQSRMSRMEAIFRKAGKSYTNAITGAALSLVGANALDAMMRGLGEELKTLDLSKIRDMEQIFGRVGGLLEDALKKIPVLGGAFSLGEGIATALNFGGLKDSQTEAQASANHLEAMRKLGEESKRFEEQRLKAAQAYSEFSRDTTNSLEQQLRLLNATSDEERIAIERQNEFNRLREKAVDLMEKSKLPIEDQLEALRLMKEQFDKISEKQRQIREDAEKQAEIAEKQAQIENFQREQGRLNRERESAEADRLGELARIQGASNVQSIGTAVGGVRVAGAVDYSSERMATNLERIRDIDAKIEDNTKYLRELRAN